MRLLIGRTFLVVGIISGIVLSYGIITHQAWAGTANNLVSLIPFFISLLQVFFSFPLLKVSRQSSTSSFSVSSPPIANPPRVQKPLGSSNNKVKGRVKKGFTIFITTDILFVLLLVFFLNILPNIKPSVPYLAMSYKGYALDSFANTRSDVCLDQIIQQGTRFSGRFISTPPQTQNIYNPRYYYWVTHFIDYSFAGIINVSSYSTGGNIDIGINAGSYYPYLIELYGELQPDKSITGDLFDKGIDWHLNPQQGACQTSTEVSS